MKIYAFIIYTQLHFLILFTVVFAYLMFIPAYFNVNNKRFLINAALLTSPIFIISMRLLIRNLREYKELLLEGSYIRGNMYPRWGVRIRHMRAYDVEFTLNGKTYEVLVEKVVDRKDGGVAYLIVDPQKPEHIFMCLDKKDWERAKRWKREISTD